MAGKGGSSDGPTVGSGPNKKVTKNF